MKGKKRKYHGGEGYCETRSERTARDVEGKVMGGGRGGG